MQVQFLTTGKNKLNITDPSPWARERSEKSEFKIRRKKKSIKRSPYNKCYS